MAKHTIISSDYYNALYTDNKLALSGKPDSLDAETLARVYPSASFYGMESDVYLDLLDGNDYPADIEQLPLERLTRYR